MLHKLLSYVILLSCPYFLSGTPIEDQISSVIGQSYESPAAQAFFKSVNINPDFKGRGEGTFNFYQQGVSIKINGSKFIQEVHLRSKSAFFDGFSQKVFGRTMNESYGENDIYKVIRQAALVDDEASRVTIYPNKTPADFYVRVERNKDGSLHSLSWMMDGNQIEKVIEENSPLVIKELSSPEAIWEIIGKPIDDPLVKQLYKNPAIGLKADEQTSYNQSAPKSGLFIYLKYKDKTKRIRHLKFFRRGYNSSKNSVSGILPGGLTWSSPLSDFENEFELVNSIPEIGFYEFQKETPKGIQSCLFNYNILIRVTFDSQK